MDSRKSKHTIMDTGKLQGPLSSCTCDSSGNKSPVYALWIRRLSGDLHQSFIAMASVFPGKYIEYHTAHG